MTALFDVTVQLNLVGQADVVPRKVTRQSGAGGTRDTAPTGHRVGMLHGARVMRARHDTEQTRMGWQGWVLVLVHLPQHTSYSGN